MAIKLNILIIDNYDSYTYNLLQYLGDHKTNVIKNNHFKDNSCFSDFLLKHDLIIISPGPGNAKTQKDVGLSSVLLDLDLRVPVLGICLGHQILGLKFGYTLTNLKDSVHGEIAVINKAEEENTILKGIDDQFEATRYHSWIVESNKTTEQTNELLPVCHTFHKEKKIIMGFRHRKYPYYSVQFHPESIGTKVGKKIFENMIAIAKNHKKEKTPHAQTINNKASIKELDTESRAEGKKPLLIRRQCYKIKVTDHLNLFENMYNDHQNAFCLDGETIYMGSCDHMKTNGIVMKYRSKNKTIEIKQSRSDLETTLEPNQDFFEYIDKFTSTMISKTNQDMEPYTYQYNGGLIGHFNYEMYNEILPIKIDGILKNGYSSRFFLPDRFITIDKAKELVYISAFVKNCNHLYPPVRNNEENVENLFDRFGITSEAFEKYCKDTEKTIKFSFENIKNDRPTLSLGYEIKHKFSKSEYIELIKKSKQYIEKGDSYELCLTNQTTLSFISKKNQDWLAMYKALTKLNNTPYNSFMRFDKDIAIISCSPELFVEIKQQLEGKRLIVCKPIKGTISRGFKDSHNREIDNQKDELNKHTLKRSKKDLAENLMIVDLYRNDLSKILPNPASVVVTKLQEVESFDYVHQMVSTVEATFYPGRCSTTAIDNASIVKSLFPPGSMTGAPKIRSIQILHQLEDKKERGAYSGCIGYFSLNGNCLFSVVIRTAVCTTVNEEEYSVSIGSGGAITTMSDPEAEYDETALKLNSVLGALTDYLKNKK